MFLPDFLKIAYELQNVGKVLITEPANDDSWLLSRQGTFDWSPLTWELSS